MDTPENEQEEIPVVTNLFDTPPETPDDDAITFEEELDTADIDLFDNSTEEAYLKGEKEKAGAGTIPLPKPMDIPTINPAVEQNAVDAVRAEIESRFSGMYKDREVEVTMVERDAFVRSALHDTEFTVDIEIASVGAVVTVAMPTDTFTSTAAATATKWMIDGLRTKHSDTVWLLSFQQMHAWFQIRAIDGIPTPWSKEVLGEDGKMLPSRKLFEKLVTPDILDTFADMNPTRWRMLMEALYISEMKYKICLQNWQDRSFFTSADTD